MPLMDLPISTSQFMVIVDLDAVTLIYVCCLIVGTYAYARYMLKSKFPHFFNSKKVFYVLFSAIIVISVLHQFNILPYFPLYDIGLTPDQHAMMDFLLIVGSLLCIGFLRKAKYVRPHDMQGIYVKKGQNPFEVAFPQWFDESEFYFPSDLPTFDFKDASKIFLRL